MMIKEVKSSQLSSINFIIDFPSYLNFKVEDCDFLVYEDHSSHL